MFESKTLVGYIKDISYLSIRGIIKNEKKYRIYFGIIVNLDNDGFCTGNCFEG